MRATRDNTSTVIKPWIEVAALHPDVVSEHFSEDIFALDLGPLADGNPHVPVVYREAEHNGGRNNRGRCFRNILPHLRCPIPPGCGT